MNTGYETENANQGLQTIEDDDITMLEPFIEVLPAVQGGARMLPPDPQRKTRKVAWLAVLLSLLSVALSAAGLFLIADMNREKDNAPAPEQMVVLPPKGTYIQYQGQDIAVKEDVPINTYQAQGFYVDDNEYICYEMDGKKAIAGVDVSYHQGSIDWNKVADAGFEFAMIRVGRRGYGIEGTLDMDSKYVENITGATAAGLDVGVYFFSQALNIWELDQEISLLKGLIAGYDITYPVVFNWEYFPADYEARTNGVTGGELTQMTQYFCKKIEEAGYTPMIYFNQELAYMSMDLSAVKEYDFWLAEYNVRPRFYYDFQMWQYTDAGRVPGIDGYVDLNLSFRDYSQED